MRKSFSKIAAALLIFTVGCNFRATKGGAEDGTVAETDVVGFSEVQAAIIGPKCARCHGTQGGVNLESFAAVTQAIGRIKARAVVDKSMPPGDPLSGAEIKMLGGWINRGAPEISSASAPVTAAATPNWSTVRDQIFTPHCIACHSSPAPEAALDLFSLTDVRAKAGRILARVLVDQDMPLAPFAKLDLAQKKTLADWVILGFPE